MKSRSKVWLKVLFCILAMVVVMAASSQAAAQDSEREFVYTINFGDENSLGNQNVSGVSLNLDTGKAKEVPGSPVRIGLGPVSITHSPDGRFVYVVLNGQPPGESCGPNSGELLSFSVNPRTGALTPVDDAMLSGLCSTGVAIDPTGNFVYAASFPFDDKVGIIDGFRTSNGHLMPLPGTPFASPLEVGSGQNPPIQDLAITADGKTLYASNPNDSRGILLFHRDTESGVLKFRKALDFGTPFGPITIALSGRFLFAVPSQLSFIFGNGRSGLYEFEIGANGNLTQSPGSPFPGPARGFADDLSISPNGEFIAFAGLSPVFVEREISHHRFAPVPGSPFGNFIDAVAFDPSGHFLVVPGTVFRVHPGTGALTKVSEFANAGTAGITIVRTCVDSDDEDRDDTHEAKHKRDADDRQDVGCHERNKDRDRDGDRDKD